MQYRETCYSLDRCAECHEEFEPRQKQIAVSCEDSDIKVHAGECWNQYKESLTGDKATAEGCIIGVCQVCIKPIRQQQQYIVSRGIPSSAEPLAAYTTFPTSKTDNMVHFMHEECSERITR
jgi:hypothetical protein